VLPPDKRYLIPPPPSFTTLDISANLTSTMSLRLSLIATVIAVFLLAVPLSAHSKKHGRKVKPTRKSTKLGGLLSTWTADLKTKFDSGIQASIDDMKVGVCDCADGV
jgi:hypothetical protein